jgi:hypothetical protein
VTLPIDVGLWPTTPSRRLIGGGTAGYNWQLSPNFVVGIEGTIDGTSIGQTSNIVTVPINGVPTAIQGSVDTN